MRCLPSHTLVSVSREDSKVQSLGTPFLSTDSECGSFGCVYGSGSPDWLARKKLPRVHMAPATDSAISFPALLSVVDGQAPGSLCLLAVEVSALWSSA